MARKELKALKAEARSASKFKEISYKLENKVVELTQNLQKRTAEKKELQAQLDELSKQLQHWMGRHEEADGRARQLQIDVTTAQQEISTRNELLRAKEDVEKRLEEALSKAIEKEDAIQKLTDELRQQASQLEAQQKAIETAPPRNVENDSIISTLKNEVSSLREQLNRSNALNALTKNSREPTSPTFAPNLRLPEPGSATSNGGPITPTLASASSTSGRHQRRHSSAGVYNLVPADNRTSADEMMILAKRSQAANPRAMSVAYNGDESHHYRGSGTLDDIYDDPAEEKIKLMQDVKHLDEDVLDGLVRGLKIPTPSLTNPAAVKEILFPSNLISLITNEMWRYGLIQESERFLANVLQTIQSNVMVRAFYSFHFIRSFISSRLTERNRSFLEYFGSQMFMRCFHSFA